MIRMLKNNAIKSKEFKDQTEKKGFKNYQNIGSYRHYLQNFEIYLRNLFQILALDFYLCSIVSLIPADYIPYIRAPLPSQRYKKSGNYGRYFFHV